MEQWKTAFKQIFGKTPTKKDFSLAPSSVRASLPVTPNKQKNQQSSSATSRKRKMLVLKPNKQLDEEFLSPIKKQRSSKIADKTLTIPDLACTYLTDTTNVQQHLSDNDQLATNLLKRPSLNCLAAPDFEDLSFFSPIKKWQRFVSSPTKSAQKRQQRLLMLSPSSLLKTPSPAKLLNRPITHTNIGYLLTPEKASTSSLEQEEDEEENNNDGFDVVDQLEPNNADENSAQCNQEEAAAGSSKDINQKKKRKTTKPKVPKPNQPNFVSINLRRRSFAPISKFRGKKWKGAKRQDCWDKRRGWRGRR